MFVQLCCGFFPGTRCFAIHSDMLLLPVSTSLWMAQNEWHKQQICCEFSKWDVWSAERCLLKRSYKNCGRKGDKIRDFGTRSGFCDFHSLKTGKFYTISGKSGRLRTEFPDCAAWHDCLNGLAARLGPLPDHTKPLRFPFLYELHSLMRSNHWQSGARSL